MDSWLCEEIILHTRNCIMCVILTIPKTTWASDFEGLVM